MTFFQEMFCNIPLISAAVAWLIAQGLKTVIWMIKHRRFSFISLVASGGMPSSHSASVCALATSVGMQAGFSSIGFAICFVFAFIVMYDAAGVRRAAGEQAKILNVLMDDIGQGHTEDMPKRLKELLGHTPLQVFAGAILGVMIALIISLL